MNSAYTPTIQDASVATRAYFEAGENVNIVAGASYPNVSYPFRATVTGHYVTP